MKIRQLPRPETFLDSAIANIDFADWIGWSAGICVVYYNEVLNQDGVLCYWSDDQRGFLCSVSHLQKIVAIGNNLFILCEDGYVEWDGALEHRVMKCPMLEWHHVHLTSWGGLGYHDFRFHCWLKENNQIVTLPVGVEKIWAAGLHGEVLWSYWGQFFVHADRTVALESIPDSMESWTAMVDGWWLALFSDQLVFWHVKHSSRVFPLDDVLDVHIRSNRQEVLVLEVDGTLISVGVDGFIHTVLECCPADSIVGDCALLAEDELILIE